MSEWLEVPGVTRIGGRYYFGYQSGSISPSALQLPVKNRNGQWSWAVGADVATHLLAASANALAASTARHIAD